MADTAESLPDDPSALKALVIAERVQNERLTAIIKALQRHRFGPRSEKIDPDQFALMLEDVEQAIAAEEAEAESRAKEQPAKAPSPSKRRVNRGALPRHLSREEIVVGAMVARVPLEADRATLTRVMRALKAAS